MRRDFLIQAAALANCFEGMGDRGKQIVETFGSLENLFCLSRREAVEICPPLRAISGKLFSAKARDDAARDVDWALEHGVRMVTIDDADYPARLRECPDAPVMLYMKGMCDFSRQRFIAIVGTRAATQYGRRYCDKIVEGLARCKPRPVVVSGLALGIDTYAHTFALRYGLDTVAVMGTGFQTIYPQTNYQLSEEILQHGALVTEFSPFTPSYPLNFVRRNRIIAGLCDCTLVVESKAKGGGLITAGLAQDYNRSVFAVPGRIDDNTFKGCNALIEDNVAAIVTGPQSIVRAMEWDVREPALPLAFGETGGGGSMNDDAGGNDSIETRIIAFLMGHPESDAETIAAGLGLPLADLSLPLLELEMSGAISLLSGNKYSAN
jgi:DNA processing protein